MNEALKNGVLQSIPKACQSGMGLLEALIGILIFSLGILAMVAMQAASVNAVADAQYRIEAVNAANQLLSQMWVNTDRTSAGTAQASLLSFEHQTTGAPAGCDFSGTAATHGAVTTWLNYLNTGGPSGAPLLPGATAARQQVQVDTGLSNRVTITMCWSAPNDTVPRRHTLVAYVN
jgi:type IV pilus assembly protein PilV